MHQRSRRVGSACSFTLIRCIHHMRNTKYSKDSNAGHGSSDNFAAQQRLHRGELQIWHPNDRPAAREPLCVHFVAQQRVFSQRESTQGM